MDEFGDTRRCGGHMLKDEDWRGPAVPRLEIRLLGPFEALRNGAPVTSFETESARALLAYLASEPGRARSRPAVAEMFWPERPEGARGYRGSAGRSRTWSMPPRLSTEARRAFSSTSCSSR